MYMKPRTDNAKHSCTVYKKNMNRTNKRALMSM